METTAPRYYFPKAINSLTTYILDLSRLGFVDTAAASARRATFQLNLLETFFAEKASCWMLDSNSMKMIWHTKLDPETLAEVRLPAPVIALEYDFINEDLGLPPVKDNSASTKRVAVLVDLQYHVDWVGLISSDDTGLDADFDEDTNGFGLYVFFFDEILGRWGLTPYLPIIKYSRLGELAAALNREGNKYSMTLDITGIIPELALEKLADSMSVPTGVLFGTLAKKAPVLDELRTTFGLLQLLACTNAPVAHLAPPAKLNKKRVKRKKHPLPSYRTLKLSQPKHRFVGPGGAGGRASPRAHIRMGHLHGYRLRDGSIRRKWLAPMWINAGKPDARGGPVDVKLKG